MSNALLSYFEALTHEEREAFAKRAETSIATIRLAANGYKTNGELIIGPEFAGRLEAASNGALQRDDLSPVCAACQYPKLARALKTTGR